MRIKAKKAMIVENMSELGVAFVIVLIAFILLSFASNLNKAEKEEKSEGEKNRAIMENTIALYLKQPVTVKGYELTMAELIVLAVENPKDEEYANKFIEASESFLGASSGLGFVITVNRKDGDLIAGTSKLGVSNSAEALQKAQRKESVSYSNQNKNANIIKTILLPSHSGEPIEVSISGYIATNKKW